MSRYTSQRVVGFCCTTSMFDNHFKSGPTSLTIEVPIYVLAKMFSYTREGKTCVHSKEVIPIFFTGNKEQDEVTFWSIQNFRDPNSCIYHAVHDILSGDKKLWIFGDEGIVKDALSILEQENFPMVLLYRNQKEEVPVICELTFFESKKLKRVMPRFLEAECVSSRN